MPTNLMTVQGQLIGLTSRSVPAGDIHAVVNIPNQNLWAKAYQNLRDGYGRAAPSTDPALAALVPHRSQLVRLPSRPVQPHVFEYEFTFADVQLARQLASDYKAFPQQLGINETNPYTVAQCLSSLMKRVESDYRRPGHTPRRVRIHFLGGVPGSGKTTALVAHLQAMHAQRPFDATSLRFHTWAHALRDPIQAAMLGVFPFLHPVNFATYGNIYVQYFGGTLVLDDATLLHAGSVPLMALTNTQITDLVITADTAQNRLTIGSPDAVTRPAISTAEWLAPFNLHYATRTLRFSAEICELFGLPPPVYPAGMPPRHGSVYVTSAAPEGVLNLVVSPRFENTLASSGVRAATFQSCQGHTAEGDIAIDLGGLTSTTPDHAFWTALTRATGNIFLVLGSSLPVTPTLDETTFARSSILSAIMAVSARWQVTRLTAAADPDRLIARAVQAHLARSVGPAAAFSLGLPAPSPMVGTYVRADIRARWLERPRDGSGDFFTARTQRAIEELGKTRGSPAFSAHRSSQSHRRGDIGHLLRLYYPICGDTDLRAESTGYTLPPLPELGRWHDPSYTFQPEVSEDHRELHSSGHPTRVHIQDGPAGWQHHYGNDRILERISIKRRIKIGDDTGPATRQERRRAALLLKGLRKFVDFGRLNEHTFAPAEFERIASRAIASWTSSRTGAAIASSIGKYDKRLDDPYCSVGLFVKQQLVKKLPAYGRTAKAAQIVSEFVGTKLFADAPWATYVEKMTLRYLRPSTYLHCRMSPDDLSTWYRRHWRRGPSTANDYTAWDSGCDKATVLALVEYFRRLGLPEPVVQRYLRDRTHVTSFLGPHMTKQESGDRWTWLANTIVNMMITGASLACPPGTPAAFSGDDSIVLGTWRRPADYTRELVSMTPKLEFGDRLEFCGYLFGGDDVYIQPKVIRLRAACGLALGRNDIDYWRSIGDAIAECSARGDHVDPELRMAEWYRRYAIQIFGLSL
jgi:hypothetical protein